MLDGQEATRSKLGHTQSACDCHVTLVSADLRFRLDPPYDWKPLQQPTESSSKQQRLHDHNVLTREMGARGRLL